MTWEDECSSLYFIREEWQTLTIDIVNVKKGFDDEYERNYWDFPIKDQEDCFLRIQSKPFLRELKQQKMLKGGSSKLLKLTFCKVGKGKNVTYKISDVEGIDDKQVTL